MQVVAPSQEGNRKKLQLFSERLKGRRNRLGLSQDALALKAKISARSIASYEGAENFPNGIKLNQLAQALGVEPGWLLGAEEISRVHDVPHSLPVHARDEATAYSWMETETLQKNFAELSSKLAKAATTDRKHIIGNLRDMLDELETRELTNSKPLSDEQQLAKRAAGESG